MKKTAVIILIVGLLLSGCQTIYPAPVHQPVENVAKIELLDTHLHDVVVLYTLNESEIPEFWEKLTALEFGRYINDPSTIYGILAVKIYYRDGYVDIIGADINDYNNPSGKSIARDGWYYVKDRNDYVELFAQYVDASLLPPADWIFY